MHTCKIRNASGGAAATASMVVDGSRKEQPSQADPRQDRAGQFQVNDLNKGTKRILNL